MDSSSITDLTPIIDLFDRPDPRVLILVGTGISYGATNRQPTTTWKGLLEHAVDYASDHDLIASSRANQYKANLAQAFEPFDMDRVLEHAAHILEQLKYPDEAHFSAWLRSAFEPLQPTYRATLDALNELRLAGALIATTNYDGLLTRVSDLPAITWREPKRFMGVVDRNDFGILHLHGHWQDPRSVVLCRKSYAAIGGEAKFQDALRALWLTHTWVYVGCGSTQNDPNLGSLYVRNPRWDRAERPHYFFGRVDGPAAPGPELPRDLRLAPYEQFEQLPSLLRKSAPTWPFELICDGAEHVFASAASLPLPSFAEYASGKVPALEIEAEVRSRLEQERWAYLRGAPSVGKTTLALRLATQVGQARRAFYVDLGSYIGEEAELAAKLRRVARQSALIIIDNVHHRADVARGLWQQWSGLPGSSRLVLVGTRTPQRTVGTPVRNLGELEKQAIDISVQEADLWNILQSVYRRAAGARARSLHAPPRAILRAWHSDFGSALGAFCIAVLSRRAELEAGDWTIPPEAAADWIRSHWLDPKDPATIANLNCVAAFGAQDLELQVQLPALPFSKNVSSLLFRSLVIHRVLGYRNQYDWFQLREPGWGRLILAAQHVEEEKILFEGAARHASVAASLIDRLRHSPMPHRLASFVAHLATHPADVLKSVPELPFRWFLSLVRAARDNGQAVFEERLWLAVEQQPAKFVSRACRTYLEQVAGLIQAAKRARRDPAIYWDALEREPHEFSKHVRDDFRSFSELSNFIEAAHVQGRDPSWLWAELERSANGILAERPMPSADPNADSAATASAALRTLEGLALFLRTARAHGRSTSPFWDYLEDPRHELPRRLLDTAPGDTSALLSVAREEGRSTGWLFHGFERDPQSFFGRVLQTPLTHVIGFIDEATQGERDFSDALWRALESSPEQLAAYWLRTPRAALEPFLAGARRHGRTLDSVWHVFERNPDTFLAECARQETLSNVADFLEVATEFQRPAALYWEALEQRPEELLKLAEKSPLGYLTRFLALAERHRRGAAFWQAIELQIDALMKRMWKTELSKIKSFIVLAADSGRDIAAYCEPLMRGAAILAERAWNTSATDLTNLLETIFGFGQPTEPLWRALEACPEDLILFALKAKGDGLVKFIAAARWQKRSLASFWKPLEARPDYFAVRALETELGDVAAFLELVRSHDGVVHHPLWAALEQRCDQAATRLFETPLHNAIAFLDTGRRHQRNMVPFWEALERKPEALIALISGASWKTKSSWTRRFRFCELAVEHGRDLAAVWRFIDAVSAPTPDQAKRFAELRRTFGLARRRPAGARVVWPEDIVTACSGRQRREWRAALSRVDDDLWSHVPLEIPLPGLAKLASWCASSRRLDLERRLIDLLLRRANTGDFQHRGGIGLADLVWVIGQGHLQKSEHVESFSRDICTEKWLRKQFDELELGALTSGLRTAALELADDSRQTFMQASMLDRLRRELQNFDGAADKQCAKIIQLVGVCALCGFHSHAEWFDGIRTETLGRLPTHVVPHTDKDIAVNWWQWELWLGLREVSTVAGPIFEGSEPVVSRTLRLWKENLRRSTESGRSAQLMVDSAMVEWLEAMRNSRSRAKRR